MNIKFTFKDSLSSGADAAILCVFSDKRLSASAERMDKESGGIISDALKRSKSFKGKSGQTMSLSAPKDSAFYNFILIGMGDVADLDALAYETAGGTAYPILKSVGAEKVALYVDDEGKREKIKSGEAAAHMAAGVALRSYTDDKHKKPKDE